MLHRTEKDHAVEEQSGAVLGGGLGSRSDRTPRESNAERHSKPPAIEADAMADILDFHLRILYKAHLHLGRIAV